LLQNIKKGACFGSFFKAEQKLPQICLTVMGEKRGPKRSALFTDIFLKKIFGIQTEIRGFP